MAFPPTCCMKDFMTVVNKIKIVFQLKLLWVWPAPVILVVWRQVGAGSVFFFFGVSLAPNRSATVPSLQHAQIWHQCHHSPKLSGQTYWPLQVHTSLERSFQQLPKSCLSKVRPGWGFEENLVVGDEELVANKTYTPKLIVTKWGWLLKVGQLQFWWEKLFMTP